MLNILSSVLFSLKFTTFAFMKRILAIFCAFATLVSSAAQPWRMRLRNSEEGVVLRIDLYEESIDVPNMELLGPMNGYLGGNGIYGVWMVTSFDIDNDKSATLRLSNDLGSDTQQVRLTQQTDSTYLMELQGNVVVKKAVNRKLVKIAPKMMLQIMP